MNLFYKTPRKYNTHRYNVELVENYLANKPRSTAAEVAAAIAIDPTDMRTIQQIVYKNGRTGRFARRKHGSIYRYSAKPSTPVDVTPPADTNESRLISVVERKAIEFVWSNPDHYTPIRAFIAWLKSE